MDLVRQKHYYLLHDLQAFSPMTSTTPPTGHSSQSGFPIIAVAIIGIFATGFLLVSYYVFVIKCCLNWHRIDPLRRFSFSRRGRMDDPLTVNIYSPPTLLENNRGLDEAVIRSIPMFQYRKSDGNKENYKGNAFCSSECAVCLNEFQEEEKLRIIPNCGHFFHIDCIDVWLQNNANCPLCRNSSISVTSRFSSMDQQIIPPMASPPPPPQDPNPNRLTGDNFITGRDEDYVVIEIGELNQTNDDRERMLMNSGELSTTNYSSSIISPSPRKLEAPKLSQKKKKKFHHISSMGDECIDTRKKDDQFEIQPMRRSISMDSAADPHLYLAVQEIMKQQQQLQNVSPSEGGSSSSSSRIRRSFFSFGHGKGSRNAVLPVHLEP